MDRYHGNVKSEQLKGHLDSVLLAVLESGPAHGYAVKEVLRQRSGGLLDLPTGTVYPALRRLERAGMVSGQWITVNGRRRRTYNLTSEGRAALAGERSSWQDFIRAVGAFLEAPREALLEASAVVGAAVVPSRRRRRA